MLDEFQELLEKVKYNPDTDRCICAGDLLDRGPKSAEVIAHAKQVGAELVIGNHDDKYIRYRYHEQKKTHVGRKHYRNPMEMSRNKLKIWETLTDEHLDYLESGRYCLPLWEYNAIVVHAGVIPSQKPLDKRDREEYIYTRYLDKDTYKQLSLGPDLKKPANSIHWTEVYDEHVDIIYGHDVRSFDLPIVEYNARGARMIGLDTGSCFGGSLSAIVLSPENPQGSFESVKAKKCWVKYQIARQ